MAESKTGKVILVGAGPGDEGLITVKGKACIETAEVIVYDYLANSALLRFAPPTAEIIYAGKKSGHATLTQEGINSLLIAKAKEGKTVVRLKGGDPFIFGRGGEEAQALKQAHIPFAVVPGIPSPVGVSAYAGIPLTHRDLASNVSIITGSNEKGNEDLHIEWEKIATRSGTLVFLMGARKLPRIVDNLIKHGKSPDTPIAVVQWGTTSRQKTWRGTLATIMEVAGKEAIKPPALTIIGEVVSLKDDVDWFETLPLFGKTIAITRAEEQSGPLIDLLREKGAEPVLASVIQTFPPEDWGPLDKAMSNLEHYYGIIFTSANGVRWFLHRLKEQGRDIRDLKGVKIFAIGPKTSKAIEELGIRVDAVPEKFVAESLLETLDKEDLKDKRFLLPRAAVAREILPETLREKGAVVDVCPAYQTRAPENAREHLTQLLENQQVDVITFTASSTVINFMEIAGNSAKQLLEQVTVACIGPITAKTAQDHGLKVDVVPEEYTIEGLVLTLEEYYREKNRSVG